MFLSTSSNLFQKEGYISLREYVDDIRHMQKYGPWKLPLSRADRLQLWILSLVVKFSWFSDMLFISYPYEWSPAYAVLISHLHKKGFLDNADEKNTNFSHHSLFLSQKHISINERISVVSGQGVDQEVSTALSKSLGEIIERMVSGLYDQNNHILKFSFDELSVRFPVVYPPRHHRFLSTQTEGYRELQHRSSNAIEWVEGVNTITRAKTYLPRHMTSWFGFGSARVFKDILQQPTSNGSAGYFSKEGAVLRGLLEVVQRDAFLVHWLTMIPPNVVQEESLPEKIQERVREFRSRGISIYILDTTTLSIPSILVVAINEQAATPRIVLSGASAVNYAEAVDGALMEMVAMTADVLYRKGGALGHNHVERGEKAPKPFISDINQETRQLYWSGDEKIEQFRWFLSGKKISYSKICVHDISVERGDIARLKACLGIFKQKGNDYYPVVYFPKNSIQEELGFYVAQVYVPKAFPLHLLECYGTFESDRLQEFALSKGAPDWTLNPRPHPFS